MKFDPIISLPNTMTGMWRRLGVHVFEGTLTLDDMARIEAIGSLWHRKNPGKVVELVIIFPSDARLSGEERARLAGIVKRWEGVRTASATVVLASGLTGAMHRSVLTGLNFAGAAAASVESFRRYSGCRRLARALRAGPVRRRRHARGAPGRDRGHVRDIPGFSGEGAARGIERAALSLSGGPPLACRRDAVNKFQYTRRPGAKDEHHARAHGSSAGQTDRSKVIR